MDYPQCYNKCVLLAVFEVVQTLRMRGVGRQLQRFSWPDNSFWTLTAIQPALVIALLRLAPG